jgi:hypothetical protein
VLSLESIFITKLIAQRDKDVADLLAILLLQPGSLNPQRFWYEAEESGLLPKLPERLNELVERIDSGVFFQTMKSKLRWSNRSIRWNNLTLRTFRQ